MNKPILIINVCKEKLHYFEFVKPIQDILKKDGKESFTRHYKKLGKKEIEKASKIIICGTSLKDNEFLKNVKVFEWIKNLDKPILGICAGMQVIALVFGSCLKKETEIGFYSEDFKKEFFGLKGRQYAYHLHNNYISLPGDFIGFTDSKIPQAIKHRKKHIYGVLFHPEVRQKDLIRNFVKL